MHCDHTVEILDCQVLEPRLMHMARAVDQMGDSPEGGDCLGHHCGHIARIRYVAGNAAGAFADFGRHGACCCRAKIVDHHLVAIRRQAQRDGPPDARPCSSDDCGTCRACHAMSSCMAIFLARRTDMAISTP